jgi:hypothetical protein
MHSFIMGYSPKTGFVLKNAVPNHDPHCNDRPQIPVEMPTFEELSTWMSDLAILRKLRFGYNFVPKRRLEAALERQNPRKHA